ncbi:unnamed protein product, partial [Closterium sp. NIES-53]
HLLAAETSAVAVGAARGTPRSPFFEGCSPSTLSSSFASAAAADVSAPEDVGAASTSAKHCNSKGKGDQGSGGGSGGGGGGSGSGSGGSGRGGGGEGGGGGGGTGGGGGGSGGGGGVVALEAGSETCPYVIRTGARAGWTCGRFHTERRYFARLDDAWRTEFGDDVERPRWAELLRSGVAIFDLDFDDIISAMYALSFSAEGDCYWCVPPDPGIAAAALGASASGTPPGTRRYFARLDDAWRTEFGDDVERPRWAELLRSGVAIFDLDFDDIISAMYALSFSAEGDCYWCVPPDPGIAAAALGASASGTPPGTAPAEPLHTFTLDSGASRCFFRDSTTLTPLPAPVPVRLADPFGGPVVASSSTVLPCPADAMVTTTTLGGQRVSICTCTRTGRHLATLTHRPMSSLYTLATKPPQVSASPPALACPALPSLRRGAAARRSSLLLVSPDDCSTAVSQHGRVGPSPHQWTGPRALLLLVVEDYTRYITVFPLCSKGEVPDVLIPWIRTVHLQLRERFGMDLLVLRLHSDRGGEFSSDLLRDFCRGEGILQSFTLPDSPQQNGIAERCIGLVMEVARTSMIHAAAPHFLWPFAVRYAAHQLKLWSRVSLPETSPTLRWTRKVGNASVFRVWGSRAFVRDTSADKLSARAIPCVFLGLVLDAPGWQFYHPTSRHVLPSQDVTFDESVPFYRLFPYRSAPSPPPPLFLAPGPPPVDPLPPQGPAPSGVSQVHPLPGTAPVQVAVISGAAPGAASGGAELEGAGSEGAGSGGAELEGVEPGGAESEGAESGGAEPQGAASSGGPAGASPRVSSQQLREWLVQRPHRQSGPPGAGKPRDAGAGAGVGGPGIGGVGATGAGDVDPGAVGARGTVRPRPYLVPLLQQVLGVPSSTGLPPPFLCPPPDQSKPPLQPASPLPVPSPYTEQIGGLTERREPASRPVSPVRTARRAPRSRPPLVPSTHTMALRPSSVPLRVLLPAPLESSLPEVPDPESERARSASPTVARLLATFVTDLSFESAAASALVAELLDFAAACRLDYASALVAESLPASPPSVGGECALGTDILEDRQEDFECLAAAVPRFASLLLALEGDLDAPDIPTPRSYAEAITGIYVDEVPPSGVNIVDGMWIFRVKRSPGSPPAFKARYVARGFSQRQGVDYFQTISPTPKMTILRVLLHVAAQRDYELHSLDFSTAFLQGSLHEEIWMRRPPGFTGSFPTGTQWSLRQPVYGLREAPREWHNTLRTTLAALGFVPSTADPSLFLRTDTSLQPFYVLVYVDDLVFAMADTEALTVVMSELQKRHTCIDLGELRSYLGLQITRDRARRTITLTQSHMVHQVLQRFGFQYSSSQLTSLSTSHSLSAPPSDESVEPSGPYPELVGCLMYLMTCTRTDLAYPLSLLARYVAPATQRSSQGYTFSLGSGSVSWRSTRSSSVFSSSCEAEIYAGAMAAQEVHWLTYLLTDLGEQPRSPPVLYVDNKAMIALCQDHRLEHRTKHIALRYFLARELQQRGQLCLAYVATWANIADVFTNALPPGDH